MRWKSYRPKLWLLILICLIKGTFTLHAAFSIGFKNITLEDNARSGREIPVTVWYPAESSGEDAIPVKGRFPLISFAHGWGMSSTLYQPLTEHIVRGGYVMLMINTETQILFPNQVEFAADLLYALNWLKLQSVEPGSFFKGIADDRAALMGHSMGGGSSIIAGGNSALIDLLILLAPADTDPSTSTKASQVSSPALIFSGSGDAVTSPDGMHKPLFQKLGSACKYFINIKGGNHCFYAIDDPMGCNLLETVAGSQTQIEREVQQDIVLDLLMPAMDFFLKGNEASYELFNDSIANGIRTEITGGCDPSGIANPQPEDDALIYPQPASEWFCAMPLPNSSRIADARLFDLSGKQQNLSFQRENRGFRFQSGKLPPGVYVLEITRQNGKQARKKVCILPANPFFVN